MTLRFYDEQQITLDAKGSGIFTFQPLTVYGVGGSVTLTITGGISGNGFVSIGNSPLGPIALAQAFGPFNVYPGGQISVKVTGGPVNGTLTGILSGATYLPGETVPAENLQFSTPEVQSTNVLVYEEDVDWHFAHVYPPTGAFSCEQFSALTLRTFGGPSVYTAGLDWFGAIDDNGDPIEECGSTEWTGGHDWSDISDSWGNLGPYVRLTITPHDSGGCGDDSENWTVVSLVPVATNDTLSLEHTFGILLNLETIVGAGTNASAKCVLTGRRDAQYIVTASAAEQWLATLSFIDSGGSEHLFLQISSESLGIGQGVALPGLPIVARFFNQGVSDQHISLNLFSGRGTSAGDSGSGGGGGGGVTSFDGRTGAVTFELSDIPNPLSNPDGDVLTLVGGVAEWVTPGASGGVTSFNTRTGAVTFVNTDIEQDSANPDDVLTWDGTGWVPSTTVNTFNSRTGAVTFILNDIPTAGATTGEVVTFDGTNVVFAPGGGSSASEFNNANPQGTELIEYKFDTSTENWTAIGGAGSVSQSGSSLICTGPPSGIGLANDPTTGPVFNDGEIWFDIREVLPASTGEGNFGIGFRVQDSTHYYLLQMIIDPASGTAGSVLFNFDTNVGNAFTTLATYLSPAHQGYLSDDSSNIVLIRMVGTYIEAFFGNTCIFQAFDPTYTTSVEPILIFTVNGSDARIDTLREYSYAGPTNRIPTT